MTDTATRNIVWRDAHPDPNDPGMWRVLNVPVFGCVEAGTKSDESITRDDLERYCEVNNRRAKGGHYRALHHIHQETELITRADGTTYRVPVLHSDRPLLSFIENWRVEETTWGPIIHVDLWGVDEFTLSQFEKGRFSYLSVEADAEEIVSIAAMQSRPPHFEFPNLFVRRVTGGSEPDAMQMGAEAAALRRQFAKDYPGRRLMQMGDQSRDKAGKFAPKAGSVMETSKHRRERRLKEAGTSPDAEGVPHRDDDKPKKKSLLKRIGSALFSDEDEVEQYMDENNEDAPPAPFADEDEDEETEQYGDEDGAQPDAGAAEAANPAEPDMNQQMMQLLQQILAAVQGGGQAAAQTYAPPQAQMVQAGNDTVVPDTMRPLEPASSAQFAGGGAAQQYARLHPDHEKLLRDVTQYASEQTRSRELRGLLSEAKASGATPDELALLEAQHDDSPKAAKQFAAYLRTRGPVYSGPSVVTTVEPPQSAVTDVIKQFAGEGAVNHPELRRLAERARQDWIDTVNDSGPNGRAMRLQFAGEEGCKRWIQLQLEQANKRQQFSRGA